jgi:molybdopterin molybdotransferase
MMRTFRDFVGEILGPLAMLPTLEVPITDAIGCRSASAVTAGQSVPGYRQSAVDGIALRVGDAAGASAATPAVLPIGATIEAGAPAEDLVEGHCARIAAGAPLPANADAVAGPDSFRLDDDKVQVLRPPRLGQGCREVGTIFRPDDIVIAEGQRLGTVAVAELALVGRPWVRVHPRPRVVIVTIGSELVRVSESSSDVQGHDAAGVALTTTAAPLGVTCHRVGPVADDPRAVRDVLEDQLVRADIIVTSGGIDSEHDVLRQELASTGVARFDGPLLHPCNAYGVGRLGAERTPIIALPGDPAAALLAFHALVRPVVDALRGASAPTIEAPLPAWMDGRGSRIIAGRYEQARFTPDPAGLPTLRQLADANAIAIQHHGEAAAEVVEWPS